MRTIRTLTAYALLAPAMTFGVSAAIAQTTPTASDSAQEQQERKLTRQDQKDGGMTKADRAQQERMAGQRAQHRNQIGGSYLSKQPGNAFRSEELIGQDLASRSDGESIGAISDLLIDEDGQIVAVIVEVGGFLGMGEKDVAIAWDAVEHSPNDEGDGHDFTVAVSKDDLKNAPEYANDRTREQKTTEASSQERSAAAKSRHAGATSQSNASHMGQRQSAARTQAQTKSSMTGKQLSRAPANAIHTDSLLGQDVSSQASEESAGTINDLVIDEQGQVVAVVVGLGGVLGIGQRNVAISWDALQFGVGTEGESKLTTSMTQDALRDAPSYERDTKKPGQQSKPVSSN